MILDDILFNKRQEVTGLKVKLSTEKLKNLIKGLPKPRSFISKGKLHLIAEIKKASPSAGVIREDFNPIWLAKTYEESGASAISVLTDEKFFQGHLDHIKQAKESTTIPILRKDFIIDESQVYESRLAGADALLLIARILTDEELTQLTKLTKKLGMVSLVEVHNEEEVSRVLKLKIPIIGINNRDLDTFKVDLNTTFKLLKKFPELKEHLVISESGISTAEEVKLLKEKGVDGILIGEAFLRSRDIAGKMRSLFN